MEPGRVIRAQMRLLQILFLPSSASLAHPDATYILQMQSKALLSLKEE